MKYHDGHVIDVCCVHAFCMLVSDGRFPNRNDGLLLVTRFVSYSDVVMKLYHTMGRMGFINCEQQSLHCCRTLLNGTQNMLHGDWNMVAATLILNTMVFESAKGLQIGEHYCTIGDYTLHARSSDLDIFSLSWNCLAHWHERSRCESLNRSSLGRSLGRSFACSPARSIPRSVDPSNAPSTDRPCVVARSLMQLLVRSRP